ncbi:MAG: glycosyltransferase family 4 protein [Candidatus Bathyarchaeia archaeon]
MKLGVESCNELLQDFVIISPKFFSLPCEMLQRRNCYLAARSCIKTLSKKSIEFSLLHVHFLDNGIIGARLKEIYSKPLVITAHGSDVYDMPFRDNWYRNLSKHVLKETDQIITVSKYNVEKLLSLGASLNKLHVIPNGYDERLFGPIPTHVARENLGLPVNKKILLSVGNLVDVKGHIYLVNAMHFVSKKRSDVILIIVGSGVLRKYLEKRVKRLGLSDRIIFIGSRPHEEIPIWMNACDLFVLPSLSEGFPTVIPEAMACGKPIVATKVGGIPEAITCDYLGILVNPKSSEMLFSAILEALEKRWEIEAILQYAKKYSWANLTKQILRVYQKTVENY